MSDDVRTVADSVMYEGFLLYPYRLSNVKNRRRATFGVLYPPGYCEAAEDNESSSLQTECLLQPEGDARVDIQVRFLHHGAEGAPAEREWRREYGLARLLSEELAAVLEFPGLKGSVLAAAAPADHGAVRLRVTVRNETQFQGTDRDAALARSFAAAHVILRATGARFVSLLDPPEALRDAASACVNRGAWPVLAGDPERADAVLSLPIILYDFPKVAPESPGDLFDGTEIDEILSLRVLTLTPEEKAEMRSADERAGRMLDRTESLSPGQWRDLHGAWRRDEAAGPLFKKGDRVRLRPRGGADSMDILLTGRLATVVSVERDLENRVYLAVALDDDPGRDLGSEGRPAHRFFFRPHEAERVE